MCQKNENLEAPKERSTSPLEEKKQSNCILFYGVTYLGCSSVNAPKSEIEINRIMSTLNEQSKMSIEVTISVPQNIEEKIVLFDAQNESIITEYKMAQVLFVVRGNKNSPDSSCFAFTTCIGDSMENLRFSCHVFKCNLADAVSKILYSFWSVFNREHQNQQQQQQQQLQNDQKQSNKRDSIAVGQFSSVATNFLGSLYGMGSLQASNLSNITSSINVIGKEINSTNSNQSTQFYSDFAIKYSNSRPEDQYIFRATLDIKEEDLKNPSNYVSVPKDKEAFKLRRNIEKQIVIQIQQLTNQSLEIERCFGVLMCPGRNVSHKDMQLLQTLSMGKSAISDSNSSGNNATSNNTNRTNSYMVSASWSPFDASISSSLAVLNEETQKDMRVFMTIAIDLVINGLQDPVRFCIETKARIFSQNEKFWVYQKAKHSEEFYLQLKNNSNSSPNTNKSNMFSLDSIFSQTELIRKKHALDQEKNSQTANELSDDESEPIISGLGNVSKDCAQEELLDWSDLLARWRKVTWNERPRGLQSLVRKGIPEALRGEVWQLLAGCNENEKSMNESYRLLLSKESPSENIIVRDINRTFTGHQFFQDENGQQALYKLSKAYSIYDEEVGYCQGLSFLIASLLLHMPEEQTFNLLVKIMYRYEVRDIYKTNFETLHLKFYQLEHLMKDYLPELHEHFEDLNIEAHMYASQWFLTLFTAKFPLYMVFRILDLFLCEGFLVVFSIALALLKNSQRDLLALDFEGILKYFRVTMPKKYRSEQSFKELMQIWSPLHAKLTEKKLKKFEKNYKIMKDAEALKEDPAIRFEKEAKKLTQTMRRLEQENDDIANEYIDTKITLSKQLEDTKDDFEMVKSELIKYKTDYQNKLNESLDTNKKLMSELDQVKQLWRKQADKYETQLERNGVIINEYKQICNTLSNKIEKWTYFKKKYKSRSTKLNLCEKCAELNKLEEDNLNASLSTIDNEDDHQQQTDIEKSSKSISTSSSTSLESNDSEGKAVDTSSDQIGENNIFKDQQLSKIKNLELELARVKLELVDAQCKNQEFDHKLKGMNNTNSSNMSKENIATSPNHSARSNSTVSQASNYFDSQMSASVSSLSKHGSVAGSNGSLYSNQANTNNWLSKTFTHFKEATNQVVQKVKNTNEPNYAN